MAGAAPSSEGVFCWLPTAHASGFCWAESGNAGDASGRPTLKFHGSAAMCFSAAASFTAAGLLLPIGAACLQRCDRCGDPSLRPLAAIPLLFATQQVLEGLIWLDLGHGSASPWRAPLSLAYLFFAYALWPAWIPWSALAAAGSPPAPARSVILRLLLAAGVLLGLVLWLPLLTAPGRAGPVPLAGSLHYGVVDFLQSSPLAHTGPAIYLVFIALPLLLVPRRSVRLFALSLTLAALLAQLWWQHAYTSVWCYFSALLSLQILTVVAAAAPFRPPAAVPPPRSTAEAAGPAPAESAPAAQDRHHGAAGTAGPSGPPARGSAAAVPVPDPM
jgi:hypothetical protein